MNLTAIISLKEKIAISAEFTPRERDFMLDAINFRIKAEAIFAKVQREGAVIVEPEEEM